VPALTTPLRAPDWASNIAIVGAVVSYAAAWPLVAAVDISSGARGSCESTTFTIAQIELEQP
jgi:hypothetical protein